MPMQTSADSPLVSESAGMLQWRQALAALNRNCLKASEKPEVGRDAFASYNHGGTIAVASAWLVIYVTAAVQPFTTWLLSLITSFL